MGKRTLYKKIFTQCDLSGLPLSHTAGLCYIPIVSEDGKLHKKGQFANWESVMRAIELSDWPEPDAKNRAILHIKTLLGGMLPDAALADVNLLEHFGGEMNAVEWHLHCCASTFPVRGVHVTQEGALKSVSLPGNMSRGLDLSPLFNGDARRYTEVTIDDKTLVAFWDPMATERNNRASDIARMNLYGHVFFVLSAKDACFLPRERYVNLDIETLFTPPSRKRKAPKSSAIQSATIDEYKTKSRDMITGFKAYEKECSKHAVDPSTMAPGAVMSRVSGKDLAVAARLRGHVCSSPPSSALRAPA